MRRKGRKVFTRVIILETDAVVEVIDLLSSQFTVDDNGHVRYFKYDTRGMDWEIVK